MKKDTDLRRDVLAELEWEPSIDAAEIGVAVHEGVVTLTGTAKSYAEKLAAERAAERLHGVKAVANDIEVRLEGRHTRTDTDIAQAAIDALKWKSLIPDGHIKLAVSRGWVTLEGEVDWQYQKDAAFDAVHMLVGVRGVTNLISVRPKASANEVKSQIEAAFRRSAELDAQSIQVEIGDGKVTLRGKVHSWSERKQAERTAWASPGVTQVDNLIAIAM
jgi:osmotically-inducible protein OsmY